MFLLAAAAFAVWWVRSGAAEPPTTPTEVVTPGPASEVLAVVGQIGPGRTDRVGAPVLGQVVEVLVSEGDEVAQGDLLLRLDDTIAVQTVRQAEATLAAARVDAEAKRRAWDRAQALADTIPQQSVENAEFQWRAAEAQVAQLEAALEQARQQLALYRITSPSDGIALSVDAEIGQVVGSSSVLVTIGDLAHPRVEADVDEIYGVRLRPGLDARISPIGSDLVLPGQVDFVAPKVDPVTGGREIRLSIEAPPVDPLPSGLTVSANIVVERFDEVITVPRSAILDLDRAPRVLIIEDGRARARPIEVRLWPSDRLIVTDGLQAGDVLILAPQDIEEGAAVRPAAG